MVWINLITLIGSGAVPFSIGAFYFPVFLALLAVLLSIVAMVQMSKEPDKYKGWSFAIMGAAFGTAFGFIILLIILAFKPSFFEHH